MLGQFRCNRALPAVQSFPFGEAIAADCSPLPSDVAT